LPAALSGGRGDRRVSRLLPQQGQRHRRLNRPAPLTIEFVLAVLRWGRGAMRGLAHPVTWSVAALTLIGAAMLAASAQARALSAAGRPDAPFTLSVSGIDRDGTAVSVSATVYSQSGVNFLLGGSSVQVPAGNYIVAAPIWRPADGSTQ